MSKAKNRRFATVAQLVEQRIRNAWVGGSSPPSGSKNKPHPVGWGFSNSEIIKNYDRLHKDI